VRRLCNLVTFRLGRRQRERTVARAPTCAIFLAALGLMPPWMVAAADFDAKKQAQQPVLQPTWASYFRV
jgi:hypothetical protein